MFIDILAGHKCSVGSQDFFVFMYIFLDIGAIVQQIPSRPLKCTVVSFVCLHALNLT